MNQCVKITLVVKASRDLLSNMIKKNAERLSIEGIGNVEGRGTIKIIAHGAHDSIDEFIDILYLGYKGARPSIIEVEPFLKNKDYRGIFRVII
jgi:acylphosphatase